MKFFLLSLLLFSLNALGAEQAIYGDLVVNGRIKAASTTKGSQPCPVMTEVQRSAIASPSNGDCVFNSDKKTLNVYDSTSSQWKTISGSGNDANLLTNPSFEDGTSGWNYTSATGISESTVVVQGTKSLVVPFTSTSVVSQDTIQYSVQYADGVQGLAMVRVKTSTTGVKLCARRANVTSTSLCVSHPGNGKWALLKVPFIFGATSNGLAIMGSTGTSGNVYIDDAFLGAVDLKADGATSTYSSTNANTDWAPCTFASLAWVGLGTVTNSLSCKREGSDLIINGGLTIGTPDASIAQFMLPTWNGVQLTARPMGAIVGRVSRAVTTANSIKTYSLFLTGTISSYLNGGVLEYAYANSPLVSLAGNVMFGASQLLVYENIRIPIQGWENSNFMIGQFNGLESCKDSYECTDTYTAFVDGAGNVSAENLDWISGNASISDTSLFTITFKTGLFTNTPNCTLTSQTSDATNQASARLATGVASTVGVRTMFGTTKTAFAFYISCSKVGSDFVGKTAKAVASDQNVSTPGALKSVLFSFTYGATSFNKCITSPCPYLDQIGTEVNSVTRLGTGSYQGNFARTYTKLKCIQQDHADSVSWTLNSQPIACSNCSATQFSSTSSGSTSVDSFGVIVCNGYYQ